MILISFEYISHYSYRFGPFLNEFGATISLPIVVCDFCFAVVIVVFPVSCYRAENPKRLK